MQAFFFSFGDKNVRYIIDRIERDEKQPAFIRKPTFVASKKATKGLKIYVRTNKSVLCGCQKVITANNLGC